MNNLRTSPPLSSCKNLPPYFFMVHLLHRLYGVDAPVFEYLYVYWPGCYDYSSLFSCVCIVESYVVEYCVCACVCQLSLQQGEDLTITDASTPNWLRVGTKRWSYEIAQFVSLSGEYLWCPIHTVDASVTKLDSLVASGWAVWNGHCVRPLKVTEWDAFRR